jgi:hypothetical protein
MIILTQYEGTVFNNALIEPLLPASSIRLGGASTSEFTRRFPGYHCSVLEMAQVANIVPSSTTSFRPASDAASPQQRNACSRVR